MVSIPGATLTTYQSNMSVRLRKVAELVTPTLRFYTAIQFEAVSGEIFGIFGQIGYMFVIFRAFSINAKLYSIDTSITMGNLPEVLNFNQFICN